MTLPVFKDPVTKESSVSLTLMVITFTIVIIKWLLGGMTFFNHAFVPVTTAEIEVWLTSTFLLYFGRQATKATADTIIKKTEVVNAREG